MNSQSPSLRAELEELLYHEADLLDSDRLEEWLELMGERIRYWAPLRANVERGRERALLEREDRLTVFDDRKEGLALRVARVRTGAAHADEPPSRVRHFISNVRLLGYEGRSARVASNFIVFRSRHGRDESLFVGGRTDRWERTLDGWRLAERMILFDHVVFDNITMLF